MKRLPLSKRIASAAGSSLLGAIYGSLFAAFCSSFSQSVLAGGVIVFLAALLGAWGGRFVGFMIGSIYGLLFVALGNAIGGSTLGVVLTILGCALLGGWLQWARDRWVERRAQCEEDFRSSNKVTSDAITNRVSRVNCGNRREKELVLCN